MNIWVIKHPVNGFRAPVDAGVRYTTDIYVARWFNDFSLAAEMVDTMNREQIIDLQTAKTYRKGQVNLAEL